MKLPKNSPRVQFNKSLQNILFVVLAIFPIIVYAIYTSINSPIPKFNQAPDKSSYLHEAGNALYKVKLGSKIDNRPTIQYTEMNGNNSIYFTYLSEKESNTVQSQASGRKLLFKNVDKHIDLEYITLENGLKENIIIKRPQKKQVFFFETDIGEIITKLHYKDSGTPAFYDKNGDYLFNILPGYAVDAVGNRTEEVSIDVIKSQGKHYLRVMVDEKWLNSSNRRYPIRVDPTIIQDTSSEFSTGEFNRSADTGSGSNPVIETYYQELSTDPITVGLWHLNEASGNAIDASGNGNTGTPTGTSATTGILGNARGFNGTTDYIATGSMAGMTTGNKPHTIEAWVKPNNTPSVRQWPLVLGGSTGGNVIWLWNTNATMALAIWDNQSCSVTPKIGSWNHIAHTYDGSILKCYLNGELISSISTSAVNFTATTLRLAQAQLAEANFNGSMDEVRVSNAPRTDEEIKLSASRKPYSTYTSDVIDFGDDISAWTNLSWNENGVLTGDGETLADTTSLVAQWNFNEANGTVAVNNAGSCGSSCNGTLTGFNSTASQDADPASSWTANNKRWGTGALMFDGVDTYLTIPDHDDLSFGNGTTDSPFTFSTWINPRSHNSTTGTWIINKRNADAADEYQMTYTTERALSVILMTGNSNYIGQRTSRPLNTGEWHHVTMTYDGSKNASGIKIYVNGKLEPSTQNNLGTYTGMSNGSHPVTIGKAAWTATRYFDGVFDTTTIFARELSANEILSNYQSGQIDIQTRVGATTDPNDGSWDDWSPVSGETSIENFDTTITKDLISYWDMDDPATTRFDKWGTNNLTQNGTGGVASTNGKINSSAQFINTESDFLEANDNDSLSTGDIDFTISTWINRTGNTGVRQSIITKSEVGGSNGEYELAYIQSTTTLKFELYDSSGATICSVDDATTINTATWYFVVVWHDSVANTCNIKVNNGTTVSTNTTGVPSNTTSNFRIGARYTTEERFLLGLIDEVGFWKRTLTATEIATLYGSGSPKNNLIGTDLTNLSQHGGIRPQPETVVVQENSASAKYSMGRLEPDGATVGLWHLDETSGTGAYIKDSSGNNNNGTPTGTTSVNGISDRGRRFNGSSDFIDAGNGASLPKSGNFTIDAWFKTSESTVTNMIASHGVWSDWHWAFSKSSSNTLNCKIYQSNSGSGYLELASPMTVNDGKWHHGACVLNGTTLTIYLDGVQVASTSATVGTRDTNSIGSLFIGKFDWSSTLNFNGDIDQVRLSNIARSADEISETFRMSRDHYINRNFSSNNISGKVSLPVYVASDRPGTYLQATMGESAYVNNQPDSNTVGQWRMDEKQTQAVIEYETASSAVCSTAGTTCTLTSMTINKGAGNNRLVVVGVGTELGGDVTNVTFDGVSGTEIAEEDTSDGNATASLWYFKDNDLPSTSGSYNVVATTTSLANRTVGAISLSGVSQLGPEAISQTSNISPTTISTSITTQSYGSIVVDTVFDGAVANFTATGDANHIKRYEGDASSSTGAGGTTTTTTPGSKTISYSASAANRLALIAAAFAPANKVVDSSGNNNHGVPTDTPIAQGKTGNAKLFNSADHVVHPLNGWSPPAATIEMWVKPNWNGNDGLVHGLWQNNNTATTNQANWVSIFKYSNNLLYLRIVNPSAGIQDCTVDATNIFTSGKWTHIAATYDSTGRKIYANGSVVCSAGAITPPNAPLDTNGRIGYGHATAFGSGSIDEVRISSTVRSAEEIRATYEYGIGLRSHAITIDFAASLDNTNLIANGSDYSFTIDARTYGLSSKGGKIYKGEKIIIKENYNGTEYIAQGTVTSVNESTGAITVGGWDTGSTFPSVGFGVNATAFKWQREYIPIQGRVLNTQLDAVTQLSLRVTDGREARTVWIDDLKSAGAYLTNPAGSTITSATGNRYFQYRVINTTSDNAVSDSISEVSIDYTTNYVPATPTLDSPNNLATGQIYRPVIQTTATDVDLDYLRYKIELCKNASMTIQCTTFDQTSSQTGWSGQNTETSTAYTSGTQATYTLQYDLEEGKTYYWKSYAIDPGGTNTWSETQSTPRAFTINALSRSNQSNEAQKYISRRESTFISSSIGWNSISGAAETGTTASANGWIAGSNFTVGEKYLILVWGSHQSDSTSAKSGIRIKHGSTPFTESQAIETTQQTSTSYKTPYFWFTVWDGLNEDIEAEIYWDGAAGTEARVEDVTVLAINVTDLIAENNLQYNISNTGGALDTSFTNKASITFTPNASNDTWWIMGYTQADIVDINSDRFEARLNINGSANSPLIITGKEASDTPLYGIGFAKELANTSQSLSIQIRESAADQEWDSAGIFALNLSTFDTYMADSLVGEKPILSTPSDWVEQSSIDPMVRKSGSFITASGAVVNDGGARVLNRIQVGNVNITDDTGGWRQQSGDVTPITLGDANISLTNGLKNIDMDSQTTLAGNARLTDVWTVGFTLESATHGAGLTQPTNAATNQSIRPQFKMTSIDPDNDTLMYKIDLCTNSLMTVGCQTFNQQSSQTGWSGQNANSFTRYTSGTEATYTLQTDLSVNTTYYWRGYSIDPSGTNTFSHTETPYSFTTTTAPNAPSVIEVEGTTNPTNVTDTTPEMNALHTDPNGDSAVHTRIQVSTNSAFSSTVWETGKIIITSTNHNTRTPLQIYAGSELFLNGQTYYVRMKVWDSNGAESDWSQTATFTMYKLEAPSSCYLIDSAPSDTSITIKWTDNSSIEDGYRVQRSVNGGSFSTLINLVLNSTQHIDTISAGNTYAYRIASRYTNTVSDWCTTSTADVKTGSINIGGVIIDGVVID